MSPDKYEKNKKSKELRNQKERFKGKRFQQVEEYSRRKVNLKKIWEEDFEDEFSDLEEYEEDSGTPPRVPELPTLGDFIVEKPRKKKKNKKKKKKIEKKIEKEKEELEEIEIEEVFEGKVMIPRKDRPNGALKILRETKMRPYWYDLPPESGLVDGDEIEFTLEEEETVKNFKLVRHVQTLKEMLESSPIVDGDIEGYVVKEYHIKNGTWKQIGGYKGTLEKRVKRPDSDWELQIKVGVTNISFHLHGPSFKGRPPLPGEVMIGARASGMQTPDSIIKAILRFHPRPEIWDK